MQLSIDSALKHRRTPAFRNRHRDSHLGLAIAAVAGVAMLSAIGAHALRRNSRRHAEKAEPEVERSLTIERSPEELYERWKDPAVFGRIIAHFARVDALDHQRARWSAGGALGSWHMRLVEDRVGELMRWQPEEETAPLRESSVSFVPARGRNGTVVTMHFYLDPPGGLVGRAAARFMHHLIPGEIASKTLHFFRSLVLTGEIPTTAHQPAARADNQ
jgi:uncharacterized membrane protein